MIKIIQRRKIWFSLSSILLAVSLFAIFSWGLKFGIDFTGGTLLEFSFNNQESVLNSDEIRDSLNGIDLGEITIQSSNDDTVFLRFKDVDENTHQQILLAINQKISDKFETVEDSAENSEIGDEVEDVSTDEPEADNDESEDSSIQVLDENGNPVDVDVSVDDSGMAEITTGTSLSYITEKRFDSIGPVIGEELKNSTAWAVLIALIAITLYIAWAFRKVSYPVSSYKYGVVALIALFHDIIITLGAFAILGHFYGVEVGVSFVAALLAILGYSINDTIVVFDRTRENLIKSHNEDFEETVNESVNETLVRSLNTSFTTLLTLFALYLFGGSSISYFVLALIIGITSGTYSSIFVASPLLVTWQKFDAKRKQ